ncbi:MAG TPA: HNH endonuclease, partial [Campylobacterales bacterium]|nr:HNH endonuclease [Campylobacterales bacterium]
KNKTPLAPTSKAKARILLKKGKATVDKIFPFTIRLKENKECQKSFEIKFDVGSSVTGVAIVDAIKCFFFAQIVHRGKTVKKAMDSRRATRRSRRNSKTRYREPRFDNRTRPKGWLPPSIKSRVDNVINFAKKYSKLISINSIVVERVSFDISSMTQDRKLYGVEYQNGELKDRKLREYIFAKNNNKCVYCGKKGQEIEHIVPKSKGGTNLIYNLTLSCRNCNIKKGKLTLKEFGKKIGKDLSPLEPKKTPKNASIIQSAREYTIKELKKDFEVKIGEGWETYANREEIDLPKEHYFDAMCIGDTYKYKIFTNSVLEVKAQGRGKRQVCLMDRFGFPRTKAKGEKIIKGFQTGDIVKAVVTKGKKLGTYLGKVAVRSSGYFNITTKLGTIQGINHKYCKTIQKGDGYSYATIKI